MRCCIDEEQDVYVLLLTCPETDDAGEVTMLEREQTDLLSPVSEWDDQKKAFPGRNKLAQSMTLERATEFGSAWNSGDPDLVASFFTDDGVCHASVGPDRLGATFVGTEEIRKGARIFFERFPDGKFENLKVVVSGTFGTFEWDFVASDATGKSVTTAGCDLLEFRGDMVVKKNAFRKVKG
jgi:hypothetical protein